MIASNEEAQLGYCLRSVREIASEIIIVVESRSADRTGEIARRFGARVVQHEWDGFARARNTYMREAKGDWILVLDADESIASSDLPGLLQLVRRRGVAGYRLQARNYTNDYDLLWNWHPNDGSYRREERHSRCHGWMKQYVLRLFRNFRDVEYSEDPTTHASLMPSLSKHRGAIEDTDRVVLHHFQLLNGGTGRHRAKQRARLVYELEHLERFPRDLDARLNAAKTLFGERRDAEAVRLLDGALRIEPSFHEASRLRAMIDFANGELHGAERRLRRILRKIPAGDESAADLWTLLGMTLVELGRRDDALHALSEALALQPRHLMAINSLGVLFEDLDDFAAARRQYKAAVRIHPQFIPAIRNLDRVSARLRRRRGER